MPGGVGPSSPSIEYRTAALVEARPRQPTWLYGAAMPASEHPPPPLAPAVKAERSASFGQAASHYERYRPGPAPEAVTWLLPTPVETVVDLGAGTGALTRLLTGRADQVIAVEPDDRMRAVLREEVPGVTVVEGRGESMPLADGIADAVVASSSWHWVDPVPALLEVARVLRPGGVLGAMWSGPDVEGPFIARARALFAGMGTDGPGSAGADETLRAMAIQGRPADQALSIPDDVPFTQPELDVQRWVMAMTADELVGLLGTFSWVILLPADEREALLSTARRLLRESLGIQGDMTVDVEYRCDVYRTQLLD
jgi:SAM-dependent methyltransferase